MAEWHELVMNNRFRLRLEQNGPELGFQEVSGLRLSAAFEPLQVGGYNHGVILLRVPVKDNGKITLKRGKYKKEATKRLKMMPGVTLGSRVYIDVLDASGKLQITYQILSPYIETVELAALQADQTAVLIETCTLMHQGIVEE